MCLFFYFVLQVESVRGADDPLELLAESWDDTASHLKHDEGFVVQAFLEGHYYQDGALELQNQGCGHDFVLHRRRTAKAVCVFRFLRVWMRNGMLPLFLSSTRFAG